ncbi:MAG TPA: hypothetical protein VJK04_02085 [Candidatus Paceibacterota bacterium]
MFSLAGYPREVEVEFKENYKTVNDAKLVKNENAPAWNKTFEIYLVLEDGSKAESSGTNSIYGAKRIYDAAKKRIGSKSCKLILSEKKEAEK